MRNRPPPLTPSLTALGALAALTLAGCGNAETTAPEPSPGSPSPVPEAGESPSPTEDSAETGDDADPAAPQDHGDTAESENTEGAEDAESSADAEDAAESEARRAPGSGLPPGGSERMAEEDFDAELHGEESEIFFYSEEGAEVGVAGLDPSEDPLAVFAEPTRSSEVTAGLESLDAVNLGGRERSHRGDEAPEAQPGSGQDGAGEDEGFWTEIELADGYGWFHHSAQDGGLYWFGGTAEVTGDFAEVPAAQDPQVIAESVGIRVAERGQEPELDDPDVGPSWVLVSDPEDFGEDFYRIDVTGFMDDSVAGQRLFVHVDEVEGGYELARVEQTLICLRGVSEGGLCT